LDWLLGSQSVLKPALDVATFLVVVVSAFIALVNLRRLRASNQLRALLAIQASFNEADLQRALGFVQRELPARLEQAAYRGELAARGFVEVERHPELRACNFFDGLGGMLKCGLIDEEGFMEVFARLSLWYWDRLEGVVALMRRNRSATEYHNFEFLAVHARRWVSRHPHGVFPSDHMRLEVVDPWREQDAVRAERASD